MISGVHCPACDSGSVIYRYGFTLDDDNVIHGNRCVWCQHQWHVVESGDREAIIGPASVHMRWPDGRLFSEEVGL